LHTRLKLQDSKNPIPYVLSTGIHLIWSFWAAPYYLSNGQLAFLDEMVGINDSKFSQGSGTIRVWEWKGGTLPFEIDGRGAPTTGNQTTTISVR